MAAPIALITYDRDNAEMMGRVDKLFRNLVEDVRQESFGMGSDMVKARLENCNGLNSMPPLSRVEVSDSEAAAIGHYLEKKK